jgi:hypothetical protein
MRQTVLAFFLAAVSLFGSNISGKWTGTLRYDGADTALTAVLMLEQDGNRVKATAGPDVSRQQPFDNGTIDGNTVHLERHSGEDDVIVVELKLENDQLVGKMTMRHGTETRTATLSLKKETN